MAIHIAVAGKGGTGKTTFSALAVRYLVEKGAKPILAVDADPNTNLNEALGLQVQAYISDVLEDVKNPKAIPTGMTKDMFIEYRLSQAITETPDVDMLVMGKPQGPGCYCYPNDLLRKEIESLSENYKHLVIDNEAGMEYISRRTIPRVDYLFVMSDASARGIRSARRINELAENLKSKIEHIYLVVTKVGEAGIGPLQDEIDKTGLTLIGTVPLDPMVTEFDFQGQPLFNLPAASGALQAVYGILEQSGL